jgi:hypothetical protein
MWLRKLFSLETLGGVSLALVLQTSYRNESGLGVGEAGLGLFLVCGLASIVLASGTAGVQAGESSLPRMFAAFVVGCLLPGTYANVTLGISRLEDPSWYWRDFTAYGLTAAFLLVTSGARLNLQMAGRILVVALAAIVCFQYAFGGPEAWFGNRFTGGAANPNQLALYIVCGFVLLAAYFTVGAAALALVGVLGFAGFQSHSDALLAFTAVTCLTYLLAVIVPRRQFVLALPLVVLLPLALWCTDGGQHVVDRLGDAWLSADEGHLRTTLYRHGLMAWWHTPRTVLFGNGAGSFSGEFGPFGRFEAHCTPIDILTIGGVIGLLVVYWLPVRAVVSAYRSSRPALFACTVGFVAFTCFHYVGRHPVFWFTMLALDTALRSASVNAATESSRTTLMESALEIHRLPTAARLPARGWSERVASPGRA